MIWFRRKSFDFWARKFPDRPSRGTQYTVSNDQPPAALPDDWARWVQHPGLVFPDLDPHILQVARMTGKKRAMEFEQLTAWVRGYQVFTVDPKSIEGYELLEKAEPLPCADCGHPAGRHDPDYGSCDWCDCVARSLIEITDQ